ncbi:MAG: type II toxin-antitoxin system RelE/ParE family toxin [Dehalococcoidia bacterium]
MRAFVTPEARQDLRNIRDFRSQWAPESAQDLIFAILRRLRQVRDFPNSGRIIPEFQMESLREVLEQGYRILYEVFPDRVEIFGVISSRQELVRRDIN